MMCRTSGRVALYRMLLVAGLLACSAVAQMPDAPSAIVERETQASTRNNVLAGTISGMVTDTSAAAIPAAQIELQDASGKETQKTARTDDSGAFQFTDVSVGTYLIRIHAKGFSPWKVENITVVARQDVALTKVELGVEELTSQVSAITVEDLAEQQITAEEHQRILGIMPNFFVSYVANAQPLTRKQKFKLAVVVSRDPLTFFTTGVTAGIEQAEGDFAGYGTGIGGYAQRYAATYGDRIDSTFFGAALLPSLLHQDPRYFYMGHGNVIKRALYAISTSVVCKGDNGKRQPNYSNVFGNLAAAGISTLYYPAEARHGVQVTVTNTLLGVAEGGIGTLLQEFLLKHLTHGVPKQP